MMRDSYYGFCRLISWFLRFRSLPRAQRIFHNVESPCLLKRPLFGFDLYLDVSRSATHQMLYLEGERLIRERFLISSLLRPGMCVVDIGANIGYYLLMFQHAVGPRGSIICIEPSPANLQELRRNISVNQFSNVELHEVAVGMDEGITGLKEGINSGITGKDQGAYNVGLATLDSLLDRGVDFVKIDVEGYEGQVLQGAARVLRESHPILFVEVHPQLTKQFGFTVKDIMEQIGRFYQTFECYGIPRPEHCGALRRVATRYSPRDVVVRIEHIQPLLEACDNGERTQPFWIVCR